ncbi:hypothetical protein GJ744_005027 [Endocarpon pusillum]|uniref:Uncharacterized protein n=1 Tax=Endocarpon pusillum TaxID=364733 RepID=A0A8H7A7I3_9EURO|nr:hypothetical protein GJ744_005027 [Endocarpon pusillum]
MLEQYYYTVQREEDGKILRCQVSGSFTCETQDSCQYHLSMRLYIDGQSTVIKWNANAQSCISPDTNNDGVQANRQDPGTVKLLPSEWIDISAEHDVELEAQKERVLIFALALDSGAAPRIPEGAPSSENVMGILGVTDDYANRTSRLWLARGQTEHEQVDVDDTHAIARCVEYICSVTAMPILPIGKSTPTPAELPSYQSQGPPDCEALKSDFESLTPLRTSLLSQDSRTGQCTLPQQSSAHHLEDGQHSPLHVPLPASIKSTSSLNDVLLGGDEPRDAEDINLGLEKDGSDEVQAITLIRNIMFDLSVNLESTFWQLRLLIKADNLLSQRYKENVSTENVVRDEEQEDGADERSIATYKKYRSRLQTVIKGVLVWMAKIPRGTRSSMGHSRYLDKEDPYSRIRPISHHYKQPFNSQPWLRPIVPYNSPNRPPWDSHWQAACFVSITIWYVLNNCPEITEEVLPISSLWKNVPEISVGELQPEAEPKTALLQWYHATCVNSFSKMVGRKSSSGHDGMSAYIKNLEQMCLRLTRPAKKPTIDPYTIKDEQLDRLLLICNEVIQEPTFANTRFDCMTNVRAKVERRTPTTIINPGFTGRKSNFSKEPPWELSCLNHHTAFRIALEFPDFTVTEVNDFKQACYDFRSTEFTFHPTWDRSEKQMSKQWWDVDASAILCATLLHPYIQKADKQRDMQASAKPITSNSSTQSNIAPFDWRKNVTPKVFGDDWVQSLEHTPDRFRSSQIKDTGLRHALRTYLEGSGSPKNSNKKHPDYSRESIDQLIPADDLLYLSHFDLGLNEIGDLDLEYSWSRSDLDELKEIFFGDIHQTKDTADIMVERLWIWVLDGSPWESFRNPKDVKEELKAKLKLRTFRQDLFKAHQHKGLKRLSHSMVDLGVKHRILLAQRLCPSIVQAIIYMWHPTAIDTFDSYFGSLSTFSDVREDDSWITTITLVYWAFVPRSDVLEPNPPSCPENRYMEPRQRGKFPPSNMLQQFHNGRDMRGDDNIQNTIEERSSSLVITGDSQGFLWTCSVWSSLIKDSDLNVSTMVQDLRLFKHQQSTGRSLAFLSILGTMCEKLSAELELTLKGCDEYVKLGQKVFLEGYDWEADNAVDRLRSMLWGLEALKMFDDRLNDSLKSIDKARETLVHQMDNERGERHSELKRTYKDALQKFGKQRDLLFAVHAKIDLKIKQVTGLRDGLSTVTSVADSRAAVKQGNNIRILTYHHCISPSELCCVHLLNGSQHCARRGRHYPFRHPHCGRRPDNILPRIELRESHQVAP